MTVYYQHIGERLAARDFPKSLGELGHLKRFSFSDIAPFLGGLSPLEVNDIRRKAEALAPTGFQIWGIPSGAQRVLDRMGTGDHLILLESDYFTYAGQVIHKTSELSHELSQHIWGETRFPIIVLLQGEIISYPWDAFVQEFSFAPNYHMRGNTASVSAERMAASAYQTEDGFMSHLLTTKGTNSLDQTLDFRAFADDLRHHFSLVRLTERDRRFRDAVFAMHGTQCAFCDVSAVVALDAAHIVPRADQGSDDPRNGLPLCSTHHRLFDANWIGVRPDTLELVARGPYTLESLAVPRSHLPESVSPHRDALQVRWSSAGLGAEV